MAVKIRLMRVGKKKQPTYRVVVADGRSPRDGRGEPASRSQSKLGRNRGLARARLAE